MESEVNEVKNSLKGNDSSSVSRGAEALQIVSSLETKAKTFEGITAVLNNQIENFLHQLQHFENSLEQEKRARQEAEKKVAQLERILTLKDVTLTELDLKIQLMELSSYNGVLLWKVTEFSRRRKEAVEGRVTSIYSQPFYSSKTGKNIVRR